LLELEVAVNTKNSRQVEAILVEAGVTVRRLTNDLDEEPDLAMHLYEIQPGMNVSIRTYYWEQHAFVLGGAGFVRGMEGETQLSEGDAVYISQTEHCQFVNRGSEVLRLLMVMPVHRNVTFADVGQKTA
jgi:quercetin dioxygenase-like cupin family protein